MPIDVWEEDTSADIDGVFGWKYWMFGHPVDIKCLDISVDIEYLDTSVDTSRARTMGAIHAGATTALSEGHGTACLLAGERERESTRPRLLAITKKHTRWDTWGKDDVYFSS